jgi:Asp-tRNA(Asn)/Glu-tRNA(Gln) amidotransferase B subunit
LSLLGRIGTAQMNRDIEKRVAMIARRQADELVEQSGIETSLEEEDIKDYITEVFEELKKQKN